VKRLDWLVCACVLALPACGGGGSGTTPVTTPPTTQPACTQNILFQGSGGTPARTIVVATDFNFNAAGRLDVIVDWTVPSSPIGVYVVPSGNCATLADFNARNCNILIRSEPSTVKPRKVSVTNVSAGTYTLLIANFSDQDESGSTQVIYSSGSCAPLAAAPMSVGSARVLQSIRTEGWR